MNPAARTRGSSQCVWEEQVLSLRVPSGHLRCLLERQAPKTSLLGALAPWCRADSGEGSSRFPCREALVGGEARHLLTILYHHALPFVIQTASALAKLTSNRFHYILREQEPGFVEGTFSWTSQKSHLLSSLWLFYKSIKKKKKKYGRNNQRN